MTSASSETMMAHHEALLNDPVFVDSGERKRERKDHCDLRTDI